MRGKVRHDWRDLAGFGITPACAGKRDRWCCGAWPLRDYPRVCGEKSVCCPLVWIIWGSPPRMRGKGAAVRCTRITPGITPAYAGKSYVAIARLLPCWDHPRVCGEKLSICTRGSVRKGSPPRMRGKVYRTHEAPWGVRITPAYAGKRQLLNKHSHQGWDHPRVCGEKLHKTWLTWSSQGSPPRMRGKEPVVIRHFRARRITPAYAGKRPAPRGGG